MKYIQNNDIRPLPDLLKKIGEDMQEVMKRKLKAQEEKAAKKLLELQRARDEMQDAMKAQLSEMESQQKDQEKEWEAKLAAALAEKEEAVREITEKYETKLREQRSKGQQEIQQLREKIKTLEAEVVVRRQLEQKVADLENVLKKRDEKIEQLEARNAQVLEELQVTGYNLKQAEKSGLDLEKSVQDLTTERNELRDTSRRHERKIQTLSEEKQKLMARIEKLMRDLEMKDSEFREKNRTILDENQSMTEQLKLLRAQQKHAAEAMEKLRLAMLDMKWKLDEWNPTRLQQEVETLAKQMEDVRRVAMLRTEQTNLLKEKNEELQTALLYVERDLVLERQLLPMMHSLSGPIGSKGLDLRPTLGGRSSSSASLPRKAAP